METPTNWIGHLISLGIGHLSPSRRWIRANGTLCEIVGYSRKELLARSLREIAHPEDMADVRTNLQQTLAGGIQARSLDIRVVRKDSFPIWVNVTLIPVPYAAGGIKYIAATVEDIGNRRRMEDGLRLFRTAVQSLPLGITIADLDGKILYMNTAEAKMHGCTVDELLGRDARLLAPPLQRNGPTLRELMARNLIGNTPFHAGRGERPPRRQDRAGGEAAPLQGRRRLVRHAEPAGRAGVGAGAARQPRAARAARLHAAPRRR